MVFCVAGNCTSDTQKHSASDGIHFHVFPRDLARKKEWTVRCGRHESWKPGAKARICSKHFANDAYRRDPSLFASIGFEGTFKPLLKDDAVPTIFEDHPSTPTPKKKPRRSGAMEKRAHKEVTTKISSPTCSADLMCVNPAYILYSVQCVA